VVAQKMLKIFKSKGIS